MTEPSEPPAANASRRAAAQRRADDAGTRIQASVRAARTDFEAQVAQARAEFDSANERIKQRTGRDLLQAIGIGVVLGVVVIASLIFFKWLFIVYALGASILGIFELGRALQAAGRRVDLGVQLVVGIALTLSGWFLGLWSHWIVVFAAIVLVVVWRLIGQMTRSDGRRPADVFDDVLTAALVQLYVPFLASLCLLLLRQDAGEWWVLAFLVVVVASDTGAYATGLAFGKHPMAPRISPKKTWEGFAGSVTVALIAGALLAAFMLHLPWWTGLIFGAAIVATATVGDLGESMIKRDLGIKDMSSWLPGHGGVLDRLDSILPSAAGALALYFLLIPLGSA